jgi:hypothetical protein
MVQDDTGKAIRKGRVVIDCRGINKAVIKDSYPIPNMADIEDWVAGAERLSSFDATKFFYQFAIHPAYRHFLAIISHRGIEVPNVALMGYKNSPPHVQRWVDRITRNFRSWMRVYIDDFFARGTDFASHIANIEQFFELCLDRNIRLSPKKCFLNYPTILLLGKKVTGKGVMHTEERLSGLLALPFPNDLQKLEYFNAATGWLRKNISRYAILVAPLKRLETALFQDAPKSKSGRKAFAKCTPITVTPELKSAYDSLKKALSEEGSNILIHHDDNRRLYFDVDASLEGIGVVAYHVEGDPERDEEIKRLKIQPIAFFSRTLTTAETKYWLTELEVSGLVWAISRLAQYLLTNKQTAICFTDHRAAIWISRQTEMKSTSIERQNLKLIRASTYVQQYDVDVRYKPGKHNTIPDALSRLPAQSLHTDHAQDLEKLDDAYLYYVTNACFSSEFREEVISGYQKDSFWRTRILELPLEHRRGYQFLLEDGLIWHLDGFDGRRRLVIPASLMKEIFATAHDAQSHNGYDRSYARITQNFYIRNLPHHLKAYIRHCPPCLRVQTARHKPYGHTTPIQTPPIPFHTQTMDFILGLPADKGHDCILLVTDKFTKLVLLIPGRTTFSAPDWATAYFAHSHMWATPQAIISDRDKKWMGHFWSALMAKLQIRQLVSTAYHPQTDGQSERTNQTAETALRFWISLGHRAWTDFLPYLMRQLNSAVSASTGKTPYQLLYGRDMGPGLDTLGEVAIPGDSANVMKQRATWAIEAADAIAFANLQMASQNDRRRRQLALEPGMQVYLLVGKYYRAPGRTGKPKFEIRRQGPFPVLRVLGNRNAVELDVPTHTQIHPIVSIEQIEPAPCEDDPFGRQVPLPTPPKMARRAVPPKIVQVLDRRHCAGQEDHHVEFLVQRQGQPFDEATWEDAASVDADLIRRYCEDRGLDFSEEKSRM